ncbi:MULTISPECIES: hypothetical protein [unclassified Kribbella]|uniref:hypothetical protein n=1 Tax=unclassified Kribbella TaxID=2644121 RepID=UPI0033D43A67
MRSPRVVYGVVAGVLVVAGFVLPRYLAERSSPELGETVVVPVSSTTKPTTDPSTPTPTPTVRPTPTAKPTVGGTTGAEPVSPGPARSAGDDDDDDLVDDPDDDDG